MCACGEVEKAKMMRRGKEKEKDFAHTSGREGCPAFLFYAG